MWVAGRQARGVDQENPISIYELEILFRGSIHLALCRYHTVVLSEHGKCEFSNLVLFVFQGVIVHLTIETSFGLGNQH